MTIATMIIKRVLAGNPSGTGSVEEER